MKCKDITEYKNIINSIAIILLLLAIPNIWPYGFYMFLRWVVTVASLNTVYLSHKLKNRISFIVFLMIAILFNPLIPISLEKEIWIIVDLLTSLIFFWSIFKLK